MKYALIGVIAFIIVVYAYTFIKHRKKRDSQTSAVKEFRKKYLKIICKKMDRLPPKAASRQTEIFRRGIHGICPNTTAP